MTKTKDQVSFNMRQIKNKDSQIELVLRKELWHRGLRYRKNVNNITGKPDIVFLRKKIAVFCDSEFWHGFDWQNRKNDIKSNKEFWISKIERTINRDIEVTQKLKNDGWLVLRFWGNKILKDVNSCANLIEEEWKRR